MLCGVMRDALVPAKDPAARDIVTVHHCPITNILLLSDRHDSTGYDLHLRAIPAPYFIWFVWWGLA